jgi:hypothetical protein
VDYQVTQLKVLSLPMLMLSATSSMTTNGKKNASLTAGIKMNAIVIHLKALEVYNLR